MARANCLLAVNDALLEGYVPGKNPGTAPGAASVLLEAPSNGHGASLGEALSEQGWRNLPTVLVLPCTAVSVRRLHFPFADIRKIRQVLSTALEEELIDDPADYAVDLEVFPDGSGEADVVAYLTPRAALTPLSEQLSAQRLSPVRTTFSARALLEAFPSGVAARFMVYAGAEEWYVAQVLDGRLHSVVSVPANLPTLLRAVHSAGLTSPALLAQAVTPSNGNSSAAAPTDAGAAQRVAAAARLQAEVAPLLEEVNRTLAIQGQGQPHEITLHGFFAPTLRVSEDGRRVEPRPHGPIGTELRQLFGVLGDLLDAPAEISPLGGLNFTRDGHGLLGQLAQVKLPLAVALLLLLLLGGLAGFGFYTRVQALQNDLKATRQELQQVLKLPGPPTPASATAALRQLTAELDRLRQERAASARFDGYDYDALRLLEGLSTLLEELQGLTVESLTYNQSRFSLSGTTPDYDTSEKLRAGLGKLEAFSGVEPKITHSRTAQSITYRITLER